VEGHVKSLLLVTYLFPPSAVSGVYRWAKMTKYLTAFGWNTTVVTAAGDLRVHADPDLALSVPPEIRVVRVRDYGCKYVAAGARRYLRLPFVEGHEGWVPFAIRAVFKELAESAYDAICTTHPPLSLMKVGCAVRRRFSIPWIMDLRDPLWTHARGSVSAPSLSEREAVRRRELEIEACSRADAVVVVDEGVRQVVQRDAGLDVRRLHVVANGYDDDDFRHARRACEDDGPFTVTFVGKLRGSYRYQAALRALRRIALECSELGTAFRVCFAGDISAKVVRDVRREMPERSLELRGYVSLRDACRRMVESDLLLFLLPSYSAGEAFRVHSKIYNYLRAGRSILAPIPDGAAARLLARSGAGIVVPPDDVDAICAALRRAIQARRRSGSAVEPDWEFVRRFERRALAREFADVLDALTEWSPSALAGAGSAR
jgi:glycosyltransferase involved in cell wall biosynthesis